MSGFNTKSIVLEMCVVCGERACSLKLSVSMSRTYINQEHSLTVIKYGLPLAGNPYYFRFCLNFSI